ncbi:MAG: gene transfer agent family protein [Pseudomonadota bacterium]
MVNRHRGEIEAKLDGKTWSLCLTLGALADLEHAFGVDDLTALTERFSAGRLSAKDMERIIAAGLRGAGHTLSDEEVRDLRSEDGAIGYARIVSDLLAETFGRSSAAGSDVHQDKQHERH